MKIRQRDQVDPIELVGKNTEEGASCIRAEPGFL